MGVVRDVVGDLPLLVPGVGAQGGDIAALGDITNFADAYLKVAQSFYSAASSDYRNVFSAVTTQLADLAGTSTTGLALTTPTAVTTPSAIPASVLPTDSRLASEKNVEDMVTKLSANIGEIQGAVVDVSSGEAKQIISLLQRLVTINSAAPLKSNV
jgi:hypothetical protein